MSKGKIEIKINEKGEIYVETHGITGPTCLDEINKLLENLALITSVSKKDDYYVKIDGRTKQQVYQKVRK